MTCKIHSTHATCMTMTYAKKSPRPFIASFESLYIYLFGRHSMQKYLEKGVIIVNHEENTPTAPPSITFFPINPKSGDGYKFEYENCDNVTGQHFIHCKERIFYSANDILLSYEIGNVTKNLLQVQSYFKKRELGLSHFVTTSKSSTLVTYINATIKLELNRNISYTVTVVDKQLSFMSHSPDAVPAQDISLKQNAGKTWVYFKVIKHEKLNQQRRPCEPSPTYVFVKCIEESIITKAGCQPPWWRFPVEGIPLCNSQRLLDKYDKEYSPFHDTDSNQLFKATNCLMPCSFLEYKVST